MGSEEVILDKKFLDGVVENLVKGVQNLRYKPSFLCVYGCDGKSMDYVASEMKNRLDVDVLLAKKYSNEKDCYNINFDSFIKQNNFHS